MIRLVNRKEEQSSGNVKRSSAAQLRVQKDLNDLDLPPCCQLEFPDLKDSLHFRVKIKPDDGMYKDGTFSFYFSISSEYPHEPPKVKCDQKIFHPNIDTSGNVCLNILRQDWKPILNISAVINGLIHLFLEPNPMDPLNKEAAEMFKNSSHLFQHTVRQTMRGGQIHGDVYDKVL